MSDERLDTLETPLASTTKEIDTGKDWELAIESLNTHMLEEAPKMTDLVRQYFLDLARFYDEASEQAEAAGEGKKLRSWMRREMKKSFVSDIKIGHRLLEWERALDRPEETEYALNTIFSEVGLKVGFGLLEKLPDTYSKPNVRATDTERRRQVAIHILDELVDDVRVANETDPKNDLVPARVGNLIKTFTLPEVGDRVEFDKTMRGVVVEHVDEEMYVESDRLHNAMDAVIVRLDNSGEEKRLLRGEKKFTQEPIARLHEAAVVRGDRQELYGQTVVVKDYEAGDSEIVEALCLDGTTVKVPARDLVRAKPKEAKVVGDLLHLVSEKGYLDKIDIAVERAEKPLLKQIEELRAIANASHEAGQIYAVSNLSEIQPEVFVEAFTAMPSEKQEIVLAQIVPTKQAPPSLDADLAIAIEGFAGEAQESQSQLEEDSSALTSDEPEEVVESSLQPGSDTVSENLEKPTEPTKTVDTLPEEAIACESQPETSVEVETKTADAIETAEPAEVVETPPGAEIACEPQPEPTPETTEDRVEVEVETSEPELDTATVERAEKLLKEAFNTYRRNCEAEKARKKGGARPEAPHSVFREAIEDEKNPQVKTFLAHPAGRYFLAAIATEPWVGVVEYIKSNWKEVDTEAICDRIEPASIEVYGVAQMFRDGNKEAIAPLEARIKIAAQYGCLTKEERLAIVKNSKSKAVEIKTPEVEAKPVTEPDTDIDIDLIRSHLLTNSHCGIAFSQMKDRSVSLEQVISVERMQAFSRKGKAQLAHAKHILKSLGREDYLLEAATPETIAVENSAPEPVISEPAETGDSEPIGW